MARLVSLLVLGTLIVGLGIAFFNVVEPFLLPLFLAAILAILFQPLFQHLRVRTGGRVRLAAALTTLAILLIILTPILVGTMIGAAQLYALAVETIGSQSWEEGVQRLERAFETAELARQIEAYLPQTVRIDEDELQAQIATNLKRMSLEVAQRTLGLAAETFGFVGTVLLTILGLAMFVIALYYFFADGPEFIATAEELIPLHRDYQRELLTRFVKVVRAIVTATFAAAVTQGIATGIGLFLAGFDQFFLLAILAMLTAMVPLAGTWLVWGPCAIWLALHGHWTAATVLTLYSALFVGFLDNIVRVYVLNTDVKLHPLLAFISVLGGLRWLGLWGVFIGPIVASCLHALIKIFNAELKAFSQQKLTTAGAEVHPVSEGAKAVYAKETAPESSASGAGNGTAPDGAARTSDTVPPVQQAPVRKRRKRR